MKTATGHYLNLFDEKNLGEHPERDIVVLFNEANSEPTGEELNVLIDLIEQELQEDPTGNSLQKVIEGTGLECVSFGVQVFAFGMPKSEEPIRNRRGRKPRYMTQNKKEA